MIYRRLSVALLSLMQAEGTDSTDAAIARHILRHRRDIPQMSVREVAEATHVGVGTVSRFCRHAGFSSFDDLRRAAAEPEDEFEVLTGDSIERAWAQQVPVDMAKAALSLDMAATEQVAKEIVGAPSTSAFGLLKAETAAICLQTDLMMLGYEVRTMVGYADQLDHIMAAPHDELILIFSATGTYFEDTELTRDQEQHLMRCNLWMVAPHGARLPGFVSGAVRFETSSNQLAHPYHLMAASSLIAQKVARLTGN